MVYVASPYTHDVRQVVLQRVEYVTRYTSWLCEQGELAYSPIVHCHPLNELFKEPDGSWQVWQKHSIYMLRSCQAMHVLELPGWEISTGVTAEIQCASNMLMPIEYVTKEEFLRCTLGGGTL